MALVGAIAFDVDSFFEKGLLIEMRKEPNTRIEPFRKKHPKFGAGKVGKNYGFFVVGNTTVMSAGLGSDGEWEHVSVACHGRDPSWLEMERIKQLFWGDEETVLQFHPKKSEYVNVHKHCLHLWRLFNIDHQLPPRILI